MNLEKNKTYPCDYPVKVLIALAEAIGGNDKIYEWLYKNGYPELSAFSSSIRANEEAYDWLMKRGFPQLAAFSYAIYGDKKAWLWLKKYHFDLLLKLGDASFANQEAIAWFNARKLQVFLIIAKKIKEVKENINRDNEDYHKIHF